MVVILVVVGFGGSCGSSGSSISNTHSLIVVGGDGGGFKD